MIEPGRIPAPYIANPESLAPKTADSLHSVFLRTCDPAAPDALIDIFFAGVAKLHEGFFNSKNPERAQTDFKKLIDQSRQSVLAGYFAYEVGFQFEPAAWKHLSIPDRHRLFSFLELPFWYEVNHQTKTASFCTLSDTSNRALQNFIQFIETNAVEQPNPAACLASPARALTPQQIAAHGELAQAEYISRIERILEDIKAGRYYELNFTQRFQIDSPLHPAHVFQHLLRTLQPARAFYGSFGDHHVISASPELFLHKSGTCLQTCPIKGSISSEKPATNRAKLNAEHVMVVDLARNDLGRIADKNWVQVEDLAAEKQFGDITHLESRITAHTSAPLYEILAATLPAASITGMPKVMVVSEITRYEASPRGLYTGSCGILWPNGDLHLNVAIRTFHCTPAPSAPAWHYTTGAGGAIVADSNPLDEYYECLMKIRPMLHALLP